MGWRADISKLKRRATDLKNYANELKTQENSLNNIIENSRSCWEGDAADIYRKQVSVLATSIRKTRDKLNNSSEELRNIADYIQSVESEREEAAREL